MLRLDRGKLEEHLYTHPVLVYRLTRGITRYVHGRLRHLSVEVLELNQRIAILEVGSQMQQSDAITRAITPYELVLD